jgi:Ni/Co efflux regulator RcnB
MKLSKFVWAVLAIAVAATPALAQDTAKPSRPEQAGSQRIDRPGDRRPDRPERPGNDDRRDRDNRPERRDRPEHPGRATEKPARPEVTARR